MVIPTSVGLREDQVKFIEEQSRMFNFSHFVRDALDGYITYKRRLDKNGKEIGNEK